MARPNGEADDASSQGSNEDAGLDMFQEPSDFRPKTPPPTFATYDLIEEGRPPYTVRMSLVGSHPLWAHHLWNAAPTTSDYLIANRAELCEGKSVLELGAGAGLPSIVAHRMGARFTLTTDYPDTDLIDNLAKNAVDNELQPKDGRETSIEAQGYIWGTDSAPLRRHLSPQDKSHFDLVLMSDLIFNHQAHGAMLDTLDTCLPPASSTATAEASHDGATALTRPHALVFFTHHRPHLADRDMALFERARERSWTCTEIGTWKMPPMFPEDPGSEEVRGTVHGWQIYR